MPPPTLPPEITSSLPTPTTFLTNLLSTLSTLQDSPPSPSATAPYDNVAPAKAHLLTLHALFPTTLLPALDLLDRRLITRCVFQDSVPADHAINADVDDNGELLPRSEGNGGSNITTTSAPTGPLNDSRGARRQVYYVQSQANSSSRYRGGETKDYEVRTRAWSCTCAAFTFAAFNASSADDYHIDRYEGDDEDEDDSVDPDLAETKEGFGRAQWGGVMASNRSSGVEGEGVGNLPLCKHLLACVLAEWWREAGAMVDDKVVGRGECAGWAAGWGG